MIGTPPTMPALREVDGVRALHLDGTGVTTVTLWIGAGLVDETFRSTGLAHLAEHVVMRALGRSTVMHNATTWPGMTEIWVRGPAAQVAEAMARICEGIRDAARGLDPSTVADETRILVAEGAPASTLFHPLYERYGLSGPGLLAIPPVAPQTLTADDVARWVSSYYVASNVVVTVLGPWPDSLHLELPTGVAAPRAEAVPLPGRTLPAQLSLPGYPGVALQWLRPRAEGHSAFDRIVADRLHTRLRTELGQSYSVTLETLPVDRRDVAVTIGLDCAPGAEGEVAQQSIAEASATG